MPTSTRAATDAEIENHFLARAATDSGYAIAYALLRLADAQHRTATPMGGLEGLGAHLGEKLELLAMALERKPTDG